MRTTKQGRGTQSGEGASTGSSRTKRSAWRSGLARRGGGRFALSAGTCSLFAELRTGCLRTSLVQGHRVL